MKCQRCGSEIDYGANKCFVCGANVYYENNENSSITNTSMINWNDDKTKEVGFYIGHCISLAVLIILWIFVPIIVPYNYEDAVKELWREYGSASDLMDIKYSLIEMFDKNIEIIKDLWDFDKGGEFLTFISFVTVLLMIVLLIICIMAVIGLIRHDKDYLTNCSIFAIFSIIMSICMFVFAMAYNSFVDKKILKLGYMGYVIPILALIYNATLIKMTEDFNKKKKSNKNIMKID